MICTQITLPIDYTEEDILRAVTERLPIELREIRESRILRRNLIGNKGGFSYRMTVAVGLSQERERGLLKMRKVVFEAPDTALQIPEAKVSVSPVVVGSGPAGLFAALILAQAGCRPILIERGEPVEKRVSDVDFFHRTGILDPESNVQFGEGGAGTFSDGKLKCPSMDAVKFRILEEMVAQGAPEDILYSDSAHVGTDILPKIMRGIREKLLKMQTTIYFRCKMTDLLVRDGRVTGVKVEKDGMEEILETNAVFLATGHSAADVFSMLEAHGVPMEAKPFGIGVRIEHPREYIDRLRYGADAERLGAASYHLVTHLPNGRNVYSFCMCPGGEVVAAASETGGIVTNGMSRFRRDGENSNAALLVSVFPTDFPGTSPLAGIALQRSIERRAYAVTGSYVAPAQTLADFTQGRASRTSADVFPSYACGVRWGKTEDYLPNYITESLRAGITDFDAWMPGYAYGGAVLTGPETRSTSPVRVLRGVGGEVPGFGGLYPIGEGAGYAGGIVSSAADAIRISLKYLEKTAVVPTASPV